MVVWDLNELDLHSEYYSERGSRVLRIAENTLLVGKKITVPIDAHRSDTILHGELLPESAQVCLELHLQRKLDAGALFFEAEKKIARTICSMDDLASDVPLLSPNEDLFVERSSRSGRITVTIRQRPGASLHHFLLVQSSPGNCAHPDDSHPTDYLTPVHAYKKSQQKSESLRKTLATVRGQMTKSQPVPKTEIVALTSVERPGKASAAKSPAVTTPVALPKTTVKSVSSISALATKASPTVIKMEEPVIEKPPSMPAVAGA